VGQDEIHWWVFENETDADELLAITNEALDAAQVLKTDSAKLKDKEPESYEALLVSLREFADKHVAEIGVLLARKASRGGSPHTVYLSCLGLYPNGRSGNEIGW
jgi:hypothetical protein